MSLPPSGRFSEGRFRRQAAGRRATARPTAAPPTPAGRPRGPGVRARSRTPGRSRDTRWRSCCRALASRPAGSRDGLEAAERLNIIPPHENLRRSRAAQRGRRRPQHRRQDDPRLGHAVRVRRDDAARPDRRRNLRHRLRRGGDRTQDLDQPRLLLTRSTGTSRSTSSTPRATASSPPRRARPSRRRTRP